MNQVVDKTHGELAGGKTDVFLGVGVDNVVDAGFVRAAGLAPGHLDAGKVLQLEGNVLDDVPGQGSLSQPLQKSSRMAKRALVVVEGRYQLGQSLVEPRDRVRRPVLELADVERQVDDRRPRPDAWDRDRFSSRESRSCWSILRSRGSAAYWVSIPMAWRASTSNRRPPASTCRDEPVMVSTSPSCRSK